MHCVVPNIDVLQPDPYILLPKYCSANDDDYNDIRHSYIATSLASSKAFMTDGRETSYPVRILFIALVYENSPSRLFGLELQETTIRIQ